VAGDSSSLAEELALFHPKEKEAVTMFGFCRPLLYIYLHKKAG